MMQAYYHLTKAASKPKADYNQEDSANRATKLPIPTTEKEKRKCNFQSDPTFIQQQQKHGKETTGKCLKCHFLNELVEETSGDT